MKTKSRRVSKPVSQETTISTDAIQMIDEIIIAACKAGVQMSKEAQQGFERIFGFQYTQPSNSLHGVFDSYGRPLPISQWEAEETRQAHERTKPLIKHLNETNILTNTHVISIGISLQGCPVGPFTRIRINLASNSDVEEVLSWLAGVEYSLDIHANNGCRAAHANAQLEETMLLRTKISILFYTIAAVYNRQVEFTDYLNF